MRLIIGLGLLIIAIGLAIVTAYLFFKGFNEIGEEKNEL